MYRLCLVFSFLLIAQSVGANKIVAMPSNHAKECQSMAKSIIRMNNLDKAHVLLRVKTDINHNVLLNDCLKSESSQKFASEFCGERPGLNYCIASVNH